MLKVVYIRAVALGLFLIADADSETKCTVPEAPEHGTVQLSDELKVGSIALYSCDGDTTLIGRSTSNCLSSGQWTFDSPKCMRSCIVPAVQDGELGQYSTRRHRHGTRLEFSAFRISERIKHDEIVVLRCKNGDGNAESNEMSCNDGMWSRPLQCQPKTCEEDPPKISNGRTRNFTRINGSAVEYECEDNHDMAGRSSVHCAFGQWVGRPPTCEPRMVLQPLDVWNESQLPRPLEECFCRFDYQSDLIFAQIGDKVLSVNETVEMGERVEFSCRFPNMRIVWPTGLRMHERVAITCDACHHWQKSDLPVCETIEKGDSHIFYDSSLKILPGGKLDVPLFGRIILQCRNFWTQPNWNTGNRTGIRLSMDTNSVSIFYESYMTIDSIKLEHAGTYECHSEPRFRSSAAHLEINVGSIVCPELTTNTNRGNFNIAYENDRKVNSVARYTCKDASQKLEGISERLCQENGKWSGSDPTCDDVRCPLLDDNIFWIAYFNGRRINSTAFYNCKNFKQKIIGSGNRTCLHTGHWSGTEPTCEDITCPEFPTYNGLTVSYTEGLKMHTIATFSCLYRGTLIGSTFSRCRYNGTWSHSKPSCISVQGCRLKEDTQSLLIIDPVKDHYRFGEFVLLSCPPGQKLTSEVERMMCMGNDWSDAIPRCRELRETSPSGYRDTTKRTRL